MRTFHLHGVPGHLVVGPGFRAALKPSHGAAPRELDGDCSHHQTSALIPHVCEHLQMQSPQRGTTDHQVWSRARKAGKQVTGMFRFYTREGIWTGPNHPRPLCSVVTGVGQTKAIFTWC